MKTERWAQIEQISYDALEHSAGERTAFLDEARAGDVALRRQVAALLVFDDDEFFLLWKDADGIYRR
jgi:hypothetical protein